MENKPLNNSVKCESLVQQLAEEFVKTLPEGVAKLFNNDAFKEEAVRLFFNQKVTLENPAYSSSNSFYYDQPEFIKAPYTTFEALMAEYTFPLFDKAIREVLAENKELIVDEIKRSLSEVGVLSNIMPTAISQLTAVIVNAAADAAVKHISDNILATPIRENGVDINAISVFLSKDFSGRSKFDWAKKDVTQ